jgi:DNA-binding MarR family transcriptional regulator
MSDTPAQDSPARKARPNKGERTLVRLFPDEPRYVPKRGTYSAMPWVLRRAVALFAPREFQLLVYLYLRAGPESLVWMSDRQIAVDLGVGHRKLSPHLRSLVQRGFIRMRDHDGERFILLLDPELALRKLVARGEIPPTMRDALADDFEKIGLEPLDGKVTT